MGSKYCQDCGTKYSEGMCPNCHEELYIETTQGEFLPDYLSEEWQEKVSEQKGIVKQLRIENAKK